MSEEKIKKRAGIYAQVSEKVVAAISGLGTGVSISSAGVASSHKPNTNAARGTISAGASSGTSANTATQGSAVSAKNRPRRLRRKKKRKALDLIQKPSNSDKPIASAEAGKASSAPGQTSGASKKAKKTHSSKGFPPSRMKYREKRLAEKILSRLSSVAEGELTEQQKASKSWATQVIGKQSSQADGLSSKRQRSQETSVHPNAKRPRTHTSQNVSETRTFSQVLEGEIVIAIIDESDPDGSILPELWTKIVIRLGEIFIPLFKEYPGSIPRYRDSGWHQGRVKLIACANQRSVDLYRLAVSRIGEAWPGAKLKAVMKDEIPNRPRARSRIPAKPSEPQEILETIRLCNPQLKASTWRLTKLEEPKDDYMIATFLISWESLEPLALVGGVLNYGFTSIVLRPYKNDILPSKWSRVASAVPPATQEGCDPGGIEGNTALAAASTVPVGSHSSVPGPSDPLNASMDAVNIPVSPATSEELVNFAHLFLRDGNADSSLNSEEDDADITVIEGDHALSSYAASSSD